MLMEFLKEAKQVVKFNHIPDFSATIITLTYIIGQWLLKTVRIFSPISENDILKLNIPNNSALIWTIATTLHYSWSERILHKAVDPTSFQAYLDAKLLLMKETKYNQLANEISTIVRQVTF